MCKYKPGIYLVNTWFLTNRLGKYNPCISQEYKNFKLVKLVNDLDIPDIFSKVSYDRNIPGISKSYDIDGHIGGIYQVYTTNSNFLGLPDLL